MRSKRRGLFRGDLKFIEQVVGHVTSSRPPTDEAVGLTGVLEQAAFLRRISAQRPEQQLGLKNTPLDPPQSRRAHGSFPQELNYGQRGRLTKGAKES